VEVEGVWPGVCVPRIELAERAPADAKGASGQRAICIPVGTGA